MAEANALAPIDMMNQPVPNTATRPASGATELFGGRLEPLRQFTQQPALQRALPAIATTAAVGIAAMAYFLTQSAPQTQLYAGMADADKAAVADALTASGIPHTIDSGSGALTVDADKVHQARMALASQGLPKAQPTGDSMISSLPMGSSRAVEGETLRGAREADLSRTIEAIDAVQSARVHIASAEPSLFVREDKPATASVMLTLLNGRTLTDGQVQAIRFLVASSVPGMNAEQVSVIDQRGALLSDTATSSDMKAFQLQTQMEDRFRRALDTLLRPMLGVGNFSVEVHADVDMSESQATRESFPENDRALTREQINRSVSGTTAPAVGIPGALSNEAPQATQLQAERADGTAAATAGAAGGAGTQSNENSTRAFEVGREVSVTHNPQGRLRRVSVAVALNQGQKALTPADLAKIDALVKGAVGFDAARGDVVAINQRPFIQIEEPKVEFYEQPWFAPLAKQGFAVLVALLAFFFIGRPMMRAAKQRKIDAAKAQVALEAQLMAAIEPPAEIIPERRNHEITLDMIEAAPSYEDRANLVRAFVSQDSERAALVVRQLMQGSSNA
ncbi:flagellar basal-body MS-ring/collar protein FliF [Sphingopyxis yananensis]|uniref:flagellar basal-body MS-ring/collar protein FliF n=1 Tax=Sphingopyxis yananensis TaxID=2886687 RepID=UPI001D10284F|nr:flagellar basal-body MS-ring/collar protein FliF [Sphingopyxis yananensis]MCC2601474.1 flagellar M-ring protein FliF [Sphingopyxis yananensis]